MKISVLGTGMVGRTIATKLAELGHSVSIGTRDITATLENKEGDAYGNPPFSEWYKDHQEIKLIAFGEIESNLDLLINCTSGRASVAAIQAINKESRTGKTLLDVANPLDFSQGMPPSLNPVNTDSLAEQIQAAFPEMHVVKSLNTMNAYLMVEPSRLKGDHDVFVSGNDEKAKKEVKSVLESFGWKSEQIIDLGDLSTARGTEMLLPIWLRLYNAFGSPDFNFHIQRN